MFIIVCIYIFFSFSLCTANPLQENQLPITLNIYNQIEAGVHDQRNQTTTLENISTTVSQATIKDITFSQKIKDQGAALLASMLAFMQNRDAQLSLLEHIKKTLFQNKIRIIGMSIAGFYCYCTYKIKTLESALEAPHAWSNWKSQPVVELYAIPDITLARDLLCSIQRRYTSLTNIDDFNSPIQKFVSDVNQEKKMLTEYAKLIKMLEQFKILRFFSFNKSLYETSSTKKDTLSYLESRLWNWISEHKVNSHS